jgi:hypothetical protein
VQTVRNENSVLWNWYEHYTGGQQTDERQTALPAAPLSNHADDIGRVARRLPSCTLAHMECGFEFRLGEVGGWGAKDVQNHVNYEILGISLNVISGVLRFCGM